MEDPLKKFQWCLSVLHFQFQLICQDVFKPNFHRGLRFYLFASVLNIGVFFYVLMMWNYDDYEVMIILCLFGSLTGSVQVHSIEIFKWNCFPYFKISRSSSVRFNYVTIFYRICVRSRKSSTTLKASTLKPPILVPSTTQHVRCSLNLVKWQSNLFSSFISSSG